MRWLTKSLNRKFIAGTAAGLIISALVFLALFINMYSKALERQRSEAVSQVNRLLQTSLENAMLKRDLDGLKVIVNRLGEQSNITSVMITNPQGEIRFSSDAALLGGNVNISDERLASPSTHFLANSSGNEVLRSINPVRNKNPCTECHGPVEKSPINGILYVDYDASSIVSNARNTTLLLMASGSLIVIINLIGGWWFIRRFVLNPISQLSGSSESLAQGDLSTRVNMTGEDELSRLGMTFDRMAGNLEHQVIQLEENKHFLQELLDSIPDGVRIIDEEFNVRLANKTYYNQLGIEHSFPEEHRCYALGHDRETPCPATLMTCPVHEILNNGKPLKVLHRHNRVDGAVMDVEIFAVPMHVTEDGVPKTLIVESIRDLGKQVKFSHEQKLSDLGRLAAGVAHEIHNPLTSVRLALHAALEAKEHNADHPEEFDYYLQLVDQEIDKCIDVTERLLKLSGAPPSQPELVMLSRVIEETLSLLKWEAHKQSIELHTDLGESPLRILATDSEMRMLCLNLSQNAFHAMPNGGSLSIKAVRKDSMIEVSFEDTGVGIKDENLLRIFDPFFSLRGDGASGTGLGLSITKAIVENHNGKIQAESIYGQSSRFIVQFPDLDAPTENSS